MNRKIAFIYTIGFLLIVSACGNVGNASLTEEEHVISHDDNEEYESQDNDVDAIANATVSDGNDAESGDSTVDENQKGELIFDTVDFYGNNVTEDIISDYKVVLVNYWEPWCGPCVKEMPDLEMLYEKYKDSGLLILGVYTTFDMDEDVEYLIDEKGITYPILKADENLIKYEQSYVPATFIFDGYGNLLDENPVEGSRSYDDWESIILQYLN